ncbi:MAG TPA: F0F1 ATP synthase subunit A [candidate division Zixibacteria bacterium]|nr:F0F1 ATP synthase subunit A [candidate division Zixibacteria bacterium]HEQ97736.1 F0F1 ATP synthase subunit A [candidate division Zixibacteria bacterium]
MTISPDSIIYWEWKFITLNATIVFTWVVMAILVLISILVTRNLKSGFKMSRWQSFLETVVEYIRDQIRQIVREDPKRYLPFLGTLFMFISLSNLLAFVPEYHPPTGSIYTTGALAICVFFAVPIFGISRRGVGGYLKHYLKPTPIMFPFLVISEFSRTLALAVRLFGNVLSGTMIAAVLLAVAPLFVPVVMQVLSLLIGQIHAYIFAILAAVYIGSASRARSEEEHQNDENNQTENKDEEDN